MQNFCDVILMMYSWWCNIYDVKNIYGVIFMTSKMMSYVIFLKFYFFSQFLTS